MYSISKILLVLLITGCQPSTQPSTIKAKIALDAATAHKEFEKKKDVIFTTDIDSGKAIDYPFEVPKTPPSRIQKNPFTEEKKIGEPTPDIMKTGPLDEIIIGDINNDGLADAFVPATVDNPGKKSFFYAIFLGSPQGFNFVGNFAAGTQDRHEASQIKLIRIKNGIIEGEIIDKYVGRPLIHYGFHDNTLSEILIPVALKHPLAINTSALPLDQADKLFGKILATRSHVECVNTPVSDDAYERIYASAIIEISDDKASLQSIIGIPEKMTIKLDSINITSTTTLTDLTLNLKKLNKYEYIVNRPSRLSALHLVSDQTTRPVSNNEEDVSAYTEYTDTLSIRSMDSDVAWQLYFLGERLVAVENLAQC